MGHPGGIHVVGNLIMSPIERSRFETLVRTHHEVVFRAAFQILRNDDEALDVTQEVFLSVLEERQRLDEADDEGRVLRWIAAKRALMLLRGASRRRQREDRNAMNRETTRDHDDVVANDEAQTLWGCVSDLPEDLRRVDCTDGDNSCVLCTVLAYCVQFLWCVYKWTGENHPETLIESGTTP